MGTQNCNVCCKRGNPNEEEENEYQEEIPQNPNLVKQIGENEIIEKKLCSENMNCNNLSNNQVRIIIIEDATKTHNSLNAIETNNNSKENTQINNNCNCNNTYDCNNTDPDISANNNLRTSPNKSNLTNSEISQQNDKNKVLLSKKQLPLEIVNEDSLKEQEEDDIGCNLDDNDHAEYLKMKNYIDLKQGPEPQVVECSEITSKNLKKSKIEEYSTHKIMEDSREYENSPNISQNPARRSTKRKSTKEGYYTKLVKKEIKSDDPLELWKNLSIKELIPSNKLNMDSKEEIMFQGDLFKFAPTKNANYSQFNKYFNPKFLILTKCELRYYKNMESFLMLQNPLQRIPLFQITQVQRINITLPSKGKKMFFLALQLLSNEINKSNIFDLSQSNGGSKQYKDNKSNFNSKKNLEEICTEMFEESINEDNKDKHINYKKGVEKDKNGKVLSRKMLPIENLEISLDDRNKTEGNMFKSYINYQHDHNANINLYSNDILLFCLEKEDLINKWVAVIDYFSSKI